MKQFLFIILLFICSLSYTQKGTISVVKKKTETEVLDTVPTPKIEDEYIPNYFEASTSLGWKSPEKITGFNLRYGRLFTVSNYLNLRYGIDYENYIKSNDYYKGSTLGYYLKTKLITTNGYPIFWIPISFTHKFGLDNKLNLGVKNYNELLFGTGIGVTLTDSIEIELNINTRKPKAFVNRNTFIVPSIHITYILYRYKLKTL